MKQTPKILERGKLTYYIYDEKVIVRIGTQWISYNQYDNYNRQGITQFINKLNKSKPDEYANAVDQMTLAVQCGIRGSSTQKPKDIE